MNYEKFPHEPEVAHFRKAHWAWSPCLWCAGSQQESRLLLHPKQPPEATWTLPRTLHCMGLALKLVVQVGGGERSGQALLTLISPLEVKV